MGSERGPYLTGRSAHTFTNDAMDRLTSYLPPQVDSAGNRGTTSLTYDSASRLSSLTTPEGDLLTFGYDGFLTTSEVSSLSSLGALASWSASSNGSAVYTYSLTRDNAGRITAKSETVNGTTSQFTYAYDEAGRLASVSTGGSVTESYSYDDNGNRLEVKLPSGAERQSP